MIEIINNKDKIKDNTITELVIRVKAIIINNKNEILLGNSLNTYQFIGGHVEKNESLQTALKREIKEETGININTENILPIIKMTSYYQDYPKPNQNRKNEIYYFEIKTDKKPNINKTSYTEEEIKHNFKLQYIPLSSLENIIKQNIIQNKDDKGIQKELLKILKIYVNKCIEK